MTVGLIIWLSRRDSTSYRSLNFTQTLNSHPTPPACPHPSHLLRGPRPHSCPSSTPVAFRFPLLFFPCPEAHPTRRRFPLPCALPTPSPSSQAPPRLPSFLRPTSAGPALPEMDVEAGEVEGDPREVELRPGEHDVLHVLGAL